MTHILYRYPFSGFGKSVRIPVKEKISERTKRNIDDELDLLRSEIKRHHKAITGTIYSDFDIEDDYKQRISPATGDITVIISFPGGIEYGVSCSYYRSLSSNIHYLTKALGEYRRFALKGITPYCKN